MQIQKTNNIIWLSRINLFYFLAIILLAFFFGKERVIFCDGSMALYDIVNIKGIYFGENRITTAFNYILPFLAKTFQLPLKFIVYSLVLNYVILPVIVFILLRYKRSNIKYELAFLIAFSIFNFQTYYYPIHEYWTGFYLIFILYRVLDDVSFIKDDSLRKKCAFTLILLIFFSHINTIISILFLLMYLLYEKKITFKDGVLYALFIPCIFFVKMIFLVSGYEHNVFADVFNYNGINEVQSIIIFADLFKTLITTNINFLLISIFIFWICINNRKWKVFSVFFIELFLSFIIIFIFFREFNYNVYTEGYFKSTNIIAPIIFVNLLLQYFKNNTILFLVITNFIYSIVVLYNGGTYFEKQYKFVRDCSNRFNTNVYFTTQKDICPIELLVISRQSFIINQIENNKKSCIFVNTGKSIFVNNVFNKIINENKHNPNKYFHFDNEIRFLDADSMGIPIDSFTVIYKGNCDILIRRLTKKKQ